MIEIYTDGAYNPILRQGGWGAVVLKDNQKHVFSGMVKDTTSNRMEIAAALEGILHTPQDVEVVVYTDSQYLLGCMTRNWRRRKNLDLLDQLDKAVSERKVQWEWMSGKAKNLLHEEAHNQANLSASKDVKDYTKREGVTSTPVAVAEEELTHIDAFGHPRMVDVTDKPDTQREAVAKGRVRMKASTFSLLKKGPMPKGDVLTVAQLAGIMAAKQTPNLIPLCHPVPIGDIKVECSLDEENSAVEITSTVKGLGKTGVEMEAFTATAIAALTIYDMCKAVDRGIKIENIRLIRKSGGKSGIIKLE